MLKKDLGSKLIEAIGIHALEAIQLEGEDWKDERL
jgi:hypothetical protein